MEAGFIFQPPPFLGAGFRQNHQIRNLKSNSYPYLSSHRSVQPSLSHASTSAGLLISRGVPHVPGLSRTNLTSSRRKHLRRCYDLVHVCLQRREIRLAARFLKVVLGAHEWTSDQGWRLALLLLSLDDSHASTEEQNDAERSRRRIGYLQSLDLHSSAPFKATHLTPLLIQDLIHANRLNDAIELLEQRVNLHPYKGQPELHTLLGMLYLFVGLSSLLLNNAEAERGEGVDVRRLDRTSKNKARRCFETAVQTTVAWKREQLAKRQRVWGMHWKHVTKDRGKVEARRGVIWGRDVLAEDEEDKWPEVEHKDLKRARRRLEGDVAEGEEAGGREVSDVNSSASGSLYAESASDTDDDEDEQRGRSRAHTPVTDADADADPLPPLANKSYESWLQAWPQVSRFHTPEPPLAYHLAQQFLSLLGPTPASQPARHTSIHTTRTPEDEDVDSATEHVVGVSLTREEAEERLRRILFEDPTPPDGRSPSTQERRVKDKKRARDTNARRDKEDHPTHARETRETSQDRKRRRRKETIVPGGGQRQPERKKRRQ